MTSLINLIYVGVQKKKDSETKAGWEMRLEEEIYKKNNEEMQKY